MFVKKLAAAAVAAALCGAASAAGIELYGALDTGFTYTHSQDADIDRFEMTTGNYAGSRWGIRGSEDLGNGNTVGFILESGFQSDTGALSYDGKIFGRESQISLSGDWGTVGFGRFGAFTSGMSSLSWFWDMEPFETGYIDAGVQATQVNAWRLNSNAMYYVSPVFAGFKFGIQHSLTGSADAEAQKFGDNSTFTNAALRWDGANARAILGVELETFGDKEVWQGSEYYDERRDDAWSVKLAGACNPNGGPLTMYLGASWYKNYTTISDATYDDDAKIEFDRASSKRLEGYSVYAGVRYTVGRADWLAMLQYLDGENKGAASDSVQDKDFKRYVASVGCHYHFSDRTMLYAVASYADGTGLFDDFDTTDTDRYMAHLGLTHYF